MIDVAVIGAGAAGIAAALHLRAAGLRVQVLEARDRVGGRAITGHSLGVAADLGAAWLHFATDNPFTTLARQHGLQVIEQEPGWGSPLLAAHFAAAEAAGVAGLDVPVSTVVPNDSHRARFDAVMTWAVGMPSEQVSTLDLHRYDESDHNWMVREGLGTVVTAAAQGLPITLNAEVTHIDWRGPGVRIESRHGVLQARAVIVTLPTAVLAGAGAPRFTPALPATHQQALHDLPLGVCNKVFLRFDEADLPSGMLHSIGDTGTSRTASWSLRPAGQPLAMAYFGGPLSQELESRGELEAFARAQLAQVFGADLARRAGAAVSTAWGRDPWARGSYSAARPGAAAARAVLATPVSPQLLLAGEACSINRYGTLPGAWDSGTQAAQTLLPTLGDTP
jgi:monoamine oxidase